MAARALVVLLSAGAADAWCCRACHKCMCSVYGFCPPGTATVRVSTLPELRLREASVTEVGGFVDSLRAGGARDICPPGCTLLEAFNSSRFVAQRIDGAGLLRFVRHHEEGLPRESIHNDTLRLAHARWIQSTALLPPSAKPDVALAFANRLRDAVHLTQKQMRQHRQKAL